MSRVVLVGEPANLRDMQPADVPLEARFSYLRWCRLHGDFSNHDFSFVDAVNCAAGTNLVLPRRATWFVSRDSDWTAATIHDFRGIDFQRDIVVEVFRQRLAGLTVKQRTALKAARDYLLAGDYRQGWCDIRYMLETNYGWTTTQLVNFFNNLLSAYPFLAKRGRETGAATLSAVTPPRIHNLRIEGVPEGIRLLPEAEWSPEMKAAALAFDRWQLARAAEDLLGRPDRWVGLVIFIDPVTEGWLQPSATVHAEHPLLRLVLQERG